jgi:hypothetical protein
MMKTLAVFLGCLFVAMGSAQTSTGELSISVLDPSGTMVPNAAVTVSGSETGNILRTLATNEKGLASAPLLPPGAYDVTAIAPGFKKTMRRQIVVDAGQNVDLKIQLELGSTSEEVTVTGQTPLIEDKSSALAQVIDQQQMLAAPLNGRNYLSLGNLVAGAIPSFGSRDQTFSAYGNTGLQNAFLLDGARNENYLRGLDNRARDMLRPERW